MPKFNHSTRQQLHTVLREQYRTASGDKAAKIATYFLSRPSAEIQSSFGISLAQVTALRNRMTAIVNRRNALQNDRGE